MPKQRRVRIYLAIAQAIIQIASATTLGVANADKAEANIRRYAPMIQENFIRPIEHLLR